MSKTEKKQTNKQTGKNDPGMEEKILAAAEKLFTQQGYVQTSTTQIAQLAGCNQALVHYYCRTKENLFQAVMGGKIKRIFTEFISLETGEGSFEEKLTRMIEVHYEVIRENPDMVLFLINEFRRDPQMFENLFAEIGDKPAKMLTLFQKDLESEIGAGRVRPITIRELVLNIVSLNAFSFLISPVYAKVWGMDDSMKTNMLDDRKKEIVKTVLLSLRP